MKLYTRRGDDGMTDLIGGRVKKCHPRVEAFGTVDELNSILGIVRTAMDNRKLKRKVERVQRDLFVLGAELATLQGKRPLMKISAKRVKALEREIDEFQKEAPSPELFVLPGGSFTAALVHLARTVCRRAERRLAALSEEEQVRPIAMQYLNRLSDWLFALALVVNRRTGFSETPWQGRRKSKR